MESKGIIFQVSEETAEVMEEISEQLFDDSEVRFDEIIEELRESVKKIEKLYSDFIGYTSRNDVQLSSNQTEILNNFSTVLENFDNFKNRTDEVFNKIDEKTNRLIENMADASKNIQVVSDSVLESSKSEKEFETTLLQTVNSLQENNEKILDVSQKNAQGIDEVVKRGEENSTIILGKIEDVMNCLNVLSNTVQVVSDRQNELCEKQSALEKDVKYLKLPFFKRWFIIRLCIKKSNLHF